MKSFKKAFNKADNYKTPRILVDILNKHISSYFYDHSCKKCFKNKLLRIWCPFDTADSEFVKAFNEWGYTVFYSDISDGKDFFNYEPDRDYDLIISNPPFSRKLDVFKRLNSLNKPWAMLCNLMCLNYQEIGEYFVKNPIQLLIPDKKVSFDGNTSSFCSAYFCKSFLYQDLIFENIKHNNTGKNYNKG